MILEIDNQGTVALVNNWSASGRTRHMDVRQKFLRELKEEGILLVNGFPAIVPYMVHIFLYSSDTYLPQNRLTQWFKPRFW